MVCKKVNKLTTEHTIEERRVNALNVLEQSLEYANTFVDFTISVQLNSFDRICSFVGLKRFANVRRLKRLKKLMKTVERRETRAIKVLKSTIEEAKEMMAFCDQEGIRNIGQIMTLDQELLLQKVKTKAAAEYCEDTINLAIRIGFEPPVNYLEWPDLGFDPVKPQEGETLEVRVKRQVQWKRFLDEVNNEKLLKTKLRLAEYNRKNNSFLESLYSRLIYLMSQEIHLVQSRFGYFRANLTTQRVCNVSNFPKFEIEGLSLHQYVQELASMRNELDQKVEGDQQ